MNSDIAASKQEAPPSRWKQFFLKSWQPVPSWTSTIIIFAVIGIILIVFGIVLTAVNANIIEVSVQYDNQPQCSSLGTCNITMNISEDMAPPVYLYYELHNFYQNHRRYIKSRSTGQLSGNNLSVSAVSSDCDPVITNSDMGVTIAFDGLTPLVSTSPANPCGLIAKSLFNDSYVMIASNQSQVTLNQNGIAWPSDIGTKFKRGTSNNTWMTYQWTDVQNEHFIVWMRTAGLPNFRKLWANIQVTVPKGQYTFEITNNYPVADFQGAKYVVLSTTGPFGGKNSFLSISYLVVGGVCLLISVFFFVRWRMFKSKKDT